MATKLVAYVVKYKTKKIKPGERIIRARNAADAIARLKNDVEGLVKIEEPRLASQKELEMRLRKKDVESITQKQPKYDKSIGKPLTAKRSKQMQKMDIKSPIAQTKPATTVNDSKENKKPILECFDFEGMIEDFKIMLANVLDD